VPLSTPRTRTPSDLKWLLNERAALLGDADQFSQGANRARGRLAKAEAALDRIRQQVADLEAQRADKLRAVSALDVVLTGAYPQVRPDAAGVVTTWAGKYGKRGTRKKFVLEFVKAAAPAAVSTAEVLAAVTAEFELLLPTRSDRNKLRAHLRQLLQQEKHLIEQLPKTKHWEPGAYRWRQVQSLASISATAQSHEPPGAHPVGAEVGGQRAGSNGG
jgi:hypothetical protein